VATAAGSVIWKDWFRWIGCAAVGNVDKPEGKYNNIGEHT
jgi:hypothetical protein